MRYSFTLRRIHKFYYGTTIGMLSEGAGIRRGLFVPGTVIGNYSCFAAGLQILPRNHASTHISQHPLFFNSRLGLVKQDTIPLCSENPILIGHDVWIGLNVIICPGCKSIGNGAVVGAGAVVTKDVAPYTIVAGNPARPIRSRFCPEVEAAVEASHWWELPLVQVVEHLDFFTRTLAKKDLEAFARVFESFSG